MSTILQKQKDAHPDIWATGDGRHIPIEDLIDEHLVSILRMLKAKGFVSVSDFEFYFNCNLPDQDTEAYWCALREQEEVLGSPVCIQLDSLRNEAQRRDLITWAF
jgi:hypothetical protein